MTPKKEIVETIKTVPIPIVDIGNLANVTPEEFDLSDPKFKKIAGEIEVALRDHGFMYLSNHGIPEDLVARTFEECHSFFTLPLEVKKKYAKSTTNTADDFNGYAAPGTEMLDEDDDDGAKEWKEMFDFYPLYNPLFPNEDAPKFHPTIKEIENVCKKMQTKLLRLVALAIGVQDTDYFLNRCLNIVDPENHPGRSIFRTIYYPPIPEELKMSGKWIGCNEHTDWGVLTLLFQDSIGGLEVKTAQGEWVKATPIPNTIICNTGGILEKWSGGYFPATFHRVHVKPVKESEVLNGETPIARQSLGLFIHPDESALIEPVKRGILPEDHPIMKPIMAGDYFHQRAALAYGQEESPETKKN